MPLRIPRIKKRTALLRKLKLVFRRFVSQPVEWVIEQINPILRGWVNYFAFVRQWVEKKIRRHLARRERPHEAIAAFRSLERACHSPRIAPRLKRLLLVH